MPRNIRMTAVAMAAVLAVGVACTGGGKSGGTQLPAAPTGVAAMDAGAGGLDEDRGGM